MNRAIAWFAENHVAANLLMMVLLVGGLLAAPTLTQELIPEVSLDRISISVEYPGATPAEVEEAISIRVEEALQGLQGVKHIDSTSGEGVSSVMVELLAGEDLRVRLDEVRARIDALDTLPVEAEEPRVAEVTMRRPALSVAISGHADERSLKELGEQLRDALTNLDGITDVGLYAARPYEIAIEVSETDLQRFGLTFDDVLTAVRATSLDLPGGSIRTDSGEILLRTKGQAYTGIEFERIPLVSRSDGTRLTIGDVAQVHDTFAETDQFSRFDGAPTVFVQVYRVGGQKELEIAETVRTFLDEFEVRVPEGVSLTVWGDSTQVLRNRLDTMLRNGRGGFILVVLILACFLRLRLALWVSLGIPTAFLGAIGAMPALGVSINFISLMAFIVVLGIVVDDAIVVGESAHTEQIRLGSKLQGAIVGAQKIAIPVCFGVLTTMAAFAPMLFLPGPQGRMTAVVPTIVIAALVFSLVEAMFILPAHLGHGRAGADAEVESQGRNAVSTLWKRFQGRVSRLLDRLVTQHYRPTLERALEWRYLTVAIALALMMVTVGLMGSGFIRFVFQTAVEADFIVVDITMPQGTPAETTGRVAAEVEQIAVDLAREVDARRPSGSESVIRHRMVSIGEQPFRDRQSSGPVGSRGRSSGGHMAEMQLDLVGAKQRDESAAELTQLLRERVGEIPGVEELSFTSTMVATAAPIEVRLRGNDVEGLQAAADSVKQHLAGFAGVYEIADSFRAGKQELELQILASGEALGITVGDLARQVRHGFYGAKAQTIQRGRDDVEVMVRYPADERRSLKSVESMRIRTLDGDEVPFGSVASASMGRGFSSIQRKDRRRVVTVTAEVDVAVANANEIVATLKSGVIDELLQPYPDVTYSFEGDQAEQRDFLAALGRGQAVALLVIYALLAVPLRSYLHPLIIMAAIPFGLVGAAWGHLLLGYDFNMYSVIGLVALSGIVVNASLVFVDYVRSQQLAGARPIDAVMSAGVARFRPIFLTSITTFAGLTPLMLETSMQAKFMIPMAISISFGVLFASLITLFLVPASYLIFEDLEQWLARLPAPDEGSGRSRQPALVASRRSSREDDVVRRSA